MDEDKKNARMKRAQRAALMNGVREQTISVTYDNKALAGLNEPWSNAACMGYCLMAMQQAGVPEPMQKKVLVCLEEKFDFSAWKTPKRLDTGKRRNEHGTLCDRDPGGREAEGTAAAL